MSYKKQASSNAYLCTISLNSEEDQQGLSKLKQGVALKRKLEKRRGAKRVPIIVVKYRKPLLPYYAHSGVKHGYGGTVCKRQLPQEADIYLHHQYA